MPVSGELGGSDDRRGRGLARRHASTVQNLTSIFGLGEEHASRFVSHSDVEEVMEVAHVNHGELRAETVDDMLE